MVRTRAHPLFLVAILACVGLALPALPARAAGKERTVLTFARSGDAARAIEHRTHRAEAPARSHARHRSERHHRGHSHATHHRPPANRSHGERWSHGGDRHHGHRWSHGGGRGHSHPSYRLYSPYHPGYRHDGYYSGYARFSVPRFIDGRQRPHFAPYYYGRDYYRPHRHFHLVYRFPVYVDGAWVFRPYAYCDGAYFAVGVFTDYGPRFGPWPGF